MIRLPGYKIEENIYKGEHSLVYTGHRLADQQQVIFKVLRGDYPSEESLARFKQEFSILKTLSGQGTVNAISIEKYNNTLVIVMDYTSLLTLENLLTQEKPTLETALKIIIKIVNALDHLHENRIIHKDINPSNMIWDPKIEEIRIIDFGCAFTLRKENLEIVSLNNLEGTLAYLAPEQTGRMNRGVGFSSDYYSLGVTIYQILTGRLPFDATDSIELVHAHIAKQPIPPHQLDNGIPSTLSNIVMKLLAKMPEDRYASLYGLNADLERCLFELQTSNNIKPFPLGEKDISSYLQIPERLYGREEEINEVTQIINNVSKNRSELLLISGYSGVGKSSLVKEVYDTILNNHGYFVSGKFDQFKRNIPYSALIEATQALIRQILLEKEETITEWRERLLKALGTNAQVIVEIIPNLKAIIGEQPEAFKVGITETQNRFKFAFQNFMQALSSPEHPLIMFLDDLQWVDLATLNLLETIFSDTDLKSLLIIGAYRDNEVDSTHPLTATLDKLKSLSVPCRKITLSPLALKDTEELIADTLYQPIELVKPLALVCYEKTQGNPFFLEQFINSSWKDNLIIFDNKNRQWTWKLDAIRHTTSTENVVELMKKKVNQLNLETQKILQIAACLGNRFHLFTLAAVSNHSHKEIADILWQALDEGLIEPNDKYYQYITNETKYNPSYRFLHDKLQQAIYQSLSSSDKEHIHLTIGRLLLKNSTPEDREDHLFDIVDHLNKSLKLITNKTEQMNIAKLNLDAGKKATNSSAYKAAYNYFNTGTELLPSNAWTNVYDLSLALNAEAAEAAFVCKEIDNAEQRANYILENTTNILDQVRIYLLKSYIYTAKSDFNASINNIASIIRKLGFEFPLKGSLIKVLSKILYNKWLLRGKSENELLTLPDMTNPYLIAATKIITSTQITVFHYDPLICFLNTFNFLRLTLRYGKNDDTAIFFLTYSLFLCSIGQIDKGYAVAKMALKFAEQTGNKKNVAMVSSISTGFVMTWKFPVRDAIPQLYKDYQQAMELGDIESALPIYSGCPYFSFLAGIELKTVSEWISKGLTRFPDYPIFVKFYRDFQHRIDQLSGKVPPPNSQEFSIKELKKRAEIYLTEKNQRDLTLTCLFASITYYIYGLDEIALQHYFIAKPYIDLNSDTTKVSFNFYNSLIRLANYKKASKLQKLQHLYAINANQKRQKKWAKFCEANNLHKYYLVEAERARLNNQFEQASRYYDQAIELARKYEYLQELALANELAAKFYLERGLLKLSKTYFSDAIYWYQQWGAFGKAKMLEKNHPELSMFDTINLLEKPKKRSTNSLTSAELDLSTYIKASQTIGSEIILSNLLKKLMSIVAENAGAQKCCLILEKRGDWQIQASIEGNEISVLQSQPLDSLPKSVIQYVIKSNEYVLLDNATDNNIYTNDSYIKEHQPKSILCLPLINKGKLSGVLYMENNLTTHSFTPDRLTLLNLLSAQIVISIENARLYLNLSDLNKVYERFVPKEFISHLGKKDIMEVKLGDQINEEMTVLFCDVRNFTSHSEVMTPQENFNYVNSLLVVCEPIIRKHHGFIDKYIGDAIMALFPKEHTDDALSSAIALLKAIAAYNVDHPNQGATEIGIGINTGEVMLGIIGGKERMEGSVISDVVNVASRTEALNKTYGTSLLITEKTYNHLNNRSAFSFRKIENVYVKGKAQAIVLYEVLERDHAKPMNTPFNHDKVSLGSTRK